MKTAAALFVFVFVITETKLLLSQYPSYRLYPSIMQQIEPFVVRNPLNQQILFASAYTISPSFRSEGIYVSTNGGNSWSGTDTCNCPNINTQNGGDPGPIIDKDGRFILTHQGSAFQGMYSNYSTNQGITWSNTYPIYIGDDQDKGAPGTDDAPASPFYGRTYLVWTRFAPPFPIVMSYTSNGGVSWTSFSQINNGFGSNRSFGPSLSINPAGIVFVVWASTIPTSPFTEDCIGIAKSTNGGLNWSVTECAIDCNGIRTTQLPPWTIRANSNPVIDIDKTGGSRNGWIYIATTNKNLPPAGSDPDIVFHRSTDGGSTWSAGVRVNQDPINNGRNQFFPAIRVDEDGGLNIIYYDSRSAADSVNIYLSRSTNGGSNWTDYLVSDHRFKPAPVAGTQGNMGDNIGLTSGNGKLYPVWMSNKTGILQVWSAIVDYTAIGIHQIGTEIPKEFGLKQNYPNPFNPTTNFEFSVAKLGFVELVIYDILGKEIATLVSQDLSPGVYRTEWNASSQPSGVYLYRLTAEKFSETRKMVVVK